MVYTPAYLASDLPLIAGDAVGTVGATTVSLIPLAVMAGAVYVGAKGVKSAYSKGKGKKSTKKKGWYGMSFEHSLASKGVKTKRYKR